MKKLPAAAEHTMSFIRTLAGGLLGGALPLAAMPATVDAPVGIDAGPAVIGSAGVFALVEAYDYPYMVGLQYRGRPLTEWLLRPGIGLAAGPDGMSFLYADLAREFALPRRWFLTLSVAGGWFVGGEEIGTGHHTQFQSGIEICRCTRRAEIVPGVSRPARPRPLSIPGRRVRRQQIAPPPRGG